MRATLYRLDNRLASNAGFMRARPYLIALTLVAIAADVIWLFVR